MIRIKPTLIRMSVAILVLLGVGALALRLRYGGGRPYPDLSGRPLLSEQALEVAVSHPDPIGNVAVSRDGRIFFTIHPESRPTGPKLWVSENGRSRPFPDAASQNQFFDAVMALRVDRFNRLWTLDHGQHGFNRTRLLAFDLDTGRVVHDQILPRDVAPRGSFIQDLQIAPDGRTAYLADVSFWRKQPALLVVDLADKRARRVLEGHASVTAQDWIIRTPLKTMTFFGGLVALKPGVDGIALSPDGRWLNYGAMAHAQFFRIDTRYLLDPTLDPQTLVSKVESVGSKPLSDGFSCDVEGHVLLTDVEHGAVLRWRAGHLETLVKSPRIRWADAVGFGPEGWLYIADSAMPDEMLRSRDHMRKAAPYFIYRIKSDIPGIPGH